MTGSAAPPYRMNMQFTAFVLAAALIQLIVAPLFFLPQKPIIAITVVLLLSFSTSLSRALLHEAIHGRLARRKDWNIRLGRVLAICSGTAFDAIRLGHMTHHRFPRAQFDRMDIIEPGKSRIGTSIKYYFGLLGGIYLREILYSMVMLLPRSVIDRVAEHALANDDPTNSALHGILRRGLDRRLRRIRIDVFFVMLIYAGAFYLYGAWWPVLLVSIALRGLIVSLQDNVAHYGTPAVVGASAHNASASQLIRLFMLNQNLHGVHHDRPELPWNVLPSALKSAGNSYTGTYFALMIRQFHGPRQFFADTRIAQRDSN